MKGFEQNSIKDYIQKFLENKLTQKVIKTSISKTIFIIFEVLFFLQGFFR